MKAIETLGLIIQNIRCDKQNYNKDFKDYYEACSEIQGTATQLGHPFINMDDCIYVFTGTFWDKVNDTNLKRFLKLAYERLSGDAVYASKRELIEGMAKQFPYTTLYFNAKQSKTKINFMNGTLDMETNSLIPHQSQDFFRYVLPYEYNPTATCPIFTRYLEEVVPEAEARMVLAEYIAWILTPDLKLEKMLFLYGSGCNGKSVFIEIVEALLGKENISHESLSDMCGETGANSRANIFGKLLNTCSDVSPNAASGDVFKRIASGEPISAKILYKDVTTSSDYAKMMFCLNELPKTNDKSNGFYRRFLIVPFNVQIPKSKIDPKLPQKIIAAELPGVMNWVLLGRQRLVQQEHFTESRLINQALEDYKNGARGGNRFKLLLPPLFK